MKINDQDKELIDIAQKIIQKRKSELSSVGTALITTNGKVYTGVNIEQVHSSPCSICAEYAAIGTMHSEAEQEIEKVVAITSEGQILPPCGQCREMIRQFGNPYVILKKEDNLFKVKLEELIPYWEM
jgi:cytidine deaminase